MKWLDGFRDKPRKVFIVHGEEESMHQFSKHIEQQLKLDTVIPTRGETYKLEVMEKEDIKIKTPTNSQFKRFELINDIDRLKEEFDDLSGMLKEELKSEIRDSELDRLKKRLSEVEKSFLYDSGPHRKLP